MTNLLAKITKLFTGLEWIMIILVCVSAVLDIKVALTWDSQGFQEALPLFSIAVILTAVIQGVWIKCMHRMK